MPADYSVTFSGSYAPDDVTFLLRPIRIVTLPVAEKEQRLLEGSAHYAEMLPEEPLPDADWLRVLTGAMQRHRSRVAREHQRLATMIAEAVSGEIVLVSFARAGTPVGVVLRRLLARVGRAVTHYSISIVLERGIDTAALDYIRARHEDGAIIFVDGWTSKGTITSELAAALSRYRRERGSAPLLRLAVLADLAGTAQLWGTRDDYLIPTALLGAVGSGLVSRTLYSAELVPDGAMHACRFYEEWIDYDHSRMLVDAISHDALDPPSSGEDEYDRAPDQCHGGSRPVERLLDWLEQSEPGVDRRVIKPGICESTRAMLRRSPVTLIVRDLQADDVAHLLLLAEQQGARIRVEPSLPVQAATIIRRAASR